MSSFSDFEAAVFGSRSSGGAEPGSGGTGGSSAYTGGTKLNIPGVAGKLGFSTGIAMLDAALGLPVSKAFGAAGNKAIESAINASRSKAVTSGVFLGALPFAGNNAGPAAAPSGQTGGQSNTPGMTGTGTQEQSTLGKTLEEAKKDYDDAVAEYEARGKQLNKLLASMGDYAGYGKDLDLAKTSAADAKAKLEEAAEAYKAAGGNVDIDVNQRIGKTIIGGGEGTLSDLLGSAGTAYEGAVRGSKAQIERDLADMQKQAEKAQKNYDETLSKYGGDVNNVNVKAAARALAEIKSNQELYQGMLDNKSLENTTAAIYGKSDEWGEKSARNIAEAKEGLGKTGQFLVDTGAAGVQLLGDIALGKATGLGMMPVMGIRSFGGGANEARQAGATYEQQFAYGGATAAIEMLTEKLADGLAGAAGKGAADDVAKEIIRKWAKTDAGRTALRAVYGVAGEAAEEAISDLVNPLARAIYDKGDSAKESYLTKEGRKDLYQEMLHDALVGGALGGLGSIGSIATGQNAAELADMRMRDASMGEQTAPAPAAPEAPAPAAPVQNGQDALLEAAGITPAAPVAPVAEAPTAAPVAETTPQATTPAERQAQIQQRLDEINAELDNPNIDEARINELMEEGNALYTEQANIARQIEAQNTQQTRIDNGEVSRTFGEAENHIDNRTGEQISDTRVKAFQYDHPELHSFFVKAAEALSNFVQAAETVDTTVRNRSTDSKYYQNKRNLYDEGVRRLVEQGLSKPRILKCLQDIINNNGAENYADAKRVELVLNDMLTNGYTTTEGLVEPNAEYIAAKETINGAKEKPAANSWEAYLAKNELSLALGEVAEDQLRAEWEAQQPAEPAPAPVSEEAPAPAQPAPQPVQAATDEAGTPPPPPVGGQTTAESTNGEGPVRERGGSANIRTNENAEADLRQSFEESPETYRQLTNAEVQAKADAILAKGFDAARSEVEQAIGRAKAGNKLSPEHLVAGFEVANELTRRGETEAANRLMADIFAEQTAAGQLGQLGRLLRQSSPAVKSMTVENIVNKINEKLTKGQLRKNMKRGQGDAEGKISVDQQLIDAFTNAETDEASNEALDAIKDDIAAQIPSTFRDKFTALRYLNMLGNLKTQLRNIIGNTAMMAATNIKYTTQAVNELVASAVSGGKYERNTALATSAQLRQQAAQDFADNIDEIKGESKYSDVAKQASRDIEDRKTVYGSGKNSEWASKLLSKATGRDVEVKKNVLEDYRLLTNWAMDAGDTIFMKAVYTRSFAGWMQAHGITDVANATPDQVARARAFATKEAQEATFHDSNAVSDWVSGLGRGDNVPAFIKAISEGIMPFRKTPANVAVRAIEYSPVGVAETIYKGIQAATGKGDATAADVINSLSKNVTGSALMVAGWFLAAAGMARGSNDDDKDLSAFEKMQGAVDYSVKIGGRNVSLSQFAPMAIPFFMGVKLNELMERSDEPLSLDDAKDILGIVTDPMLEMSMLSGVNDFMNDLSSMNGDTDAIPSLVTNAAISYLSQGLTNSLLGQLEQASEGNRQTTYVDTRSNDASEFDKRLGTGYQRKLAQAAAKIPGFDYNQQDYVDAWGRTISTGETGMRYFNALLNPTYMSNENSTEVDAELERLYKDNKGVEGFPDVLPKKRARSATIGDGVTMTPDEYLQYSKDAGAMKLGLVKDFISSEQYNNLTDQQRATIINNLYALADDRALEKAKAHYGLDNRPSEWDKASAMKDPVEFLTSKEIISQTGNNFKGTPDYSQVDSLLGNWDKLNPDTQDALSEISNVNNMRYAHDQLGVGSGEYFNIKNTVTDAEKTQLGNKTGGAADAIVLAKTGGRSDEEKLAALEALNQPDKATGKRQAIVRRFEAASKVYEIPFDKWAAFEAYIQNHAKSVSSPSNAVIYDAEDAAGIKRGDGKSVWRKISGDDGKIEVYDDYFSQNYVAPDKVDFVGYLNGTTGQNSDSVNAFYDAAGLANGNVAYDPESILAALLG